MSTPSESAVTSADAAPAHRSGLLVAGSVIGAVAGVEVLFIGVAIAGLFSGWQTGSVDGKTVSSGMFIGGSEPLFWSSVAAIVIGLVLLVLAVVPIISPTKARGLGIASIVLAIAALVVADLGGLFIGTLLGVVGGVLTVAGSRR